MARNGQKGRDEKGVACYTQAKQRQGRATPSPSRCAYQHTNKGSTWVSSAFPASWLWWSENCDLQLATWRHICGFPVVLIIKENNAQLERPDVWKESHFVCSFHLRTEDCQSILERALVVLQQGEDLLRLQYVFSLMVKQILLTVRP